MNEHFKSKRVLVTGACGTVGSELVRQLLEEYGVEELIGIDNNESELFFLEQRFSRFPNSRFFIADIRDQEKLRRLFRNINYVFHSAAFKHVILCERSPFEAVQTNILGVQNVIRAATETKVEKVIFTSSDKAVNPTNVMGTSKLMGERLMTAANSNYRGTGPIFASTRFGNVLGSRGSVVPIFREQIKKGGPVTVTDPTMTRFIMSIKQAVRLVIDSSMLACGGEVFVTKMPAINIIDLANVMINSLSQDFGFEPDQVKVKIIGTKPGEKLYEELLNDEETRRTWELERYFAILPAFKGYYRQVFYEYPEVVSRDVKLPYTSANEGLLSREHLHQFLITNGLLEEQSTGAHPNHRYWPDLDSGAVRKEE